MGIGYEAAVQALDEGEGDLVRALAAAERRQRQEMEQLVAQIREGVTRSLTGDTIGVIRWRVRDQVVGERPVRLSGLAAVVTGVLAILVSSSAIETAFTGDRDAGQSGS